MLTPISNRNIIEIHRQQRLSQALTETQVQISTGRRLQRASDDPVAAERIAALQRVQSSGSTWARNIDRGLAANAAADSATQSLTDNLASARELVLAGAGGTASVETRETYARQLEGLATAIDRLATQKDVNGAALFSTGPASVARYSDSVTLAPVPSRDALFTPSGNDLAQIVRDAASALRSGVTAATDLALDTLDTAMADATNALARIGQTGRELENLRELTASKAIELEAERSSLEDTDLSEAIARLNLQTLTLEAAQSVFARLNRQTLFDLIR
jgi:flagellar hook-associated protein 3 FlgL